MTEDTAVNGTTVRVVSLDELATDSANAREHPGKNRDIIRYSLERFGAGRSLVADSSGQVSAGNGTLEEARKAGFQEAILLETDGKRLVVVQRSDWSRDDARAYALIDNRATDTSQWNEPMLYAHLSELHERGYEIEKLGWEPNEMPREQDAPGDESQGQGRWLVVVACESAAAQRSLCDELTERGFTCQAKQSSAEPGY